MAKRNQTPQGMSPATSLMGAAKQFGKVGARGSGNKSVQPGGKNKPVPGLSPQTNPRLLGKMPPGPNPDTGARIQSSTGTQPMIPSRPNNGGGLGGLRGGPGPAKTPGGAGKVGPQPMRGGMQRGKATPAQRGIVRTAVVAEKKYGEPHRFVRSVRRHLLKGAKSEGMSNVERKYVRQAARTVKLVYGKRRGNKWKRSYKRHQG